MASFIKDDFEFFEHDHQKQGINMPSPHQHNYHELYYLVNGKATYFVGNNIYLLKPGDFCFIPKCEFHKTNYDASISIERLLFVFDDDFLGRDYSQYIEALRTFKHIQVEKESFPSLKGLFKRIEKENSECKSNYMEMNKLYLREMLLLIQRHCIINDAQNLKGTNSVIQNVAHYITQNYDKDITVDSLAAMYYLSPGHFSKQFKKITGVNPSEYITMTRITAAKEKLSSKKASITDIALECGFSDSNYFATVFKKETGTTPKKYSIQNR